MTEIFERRAETVVCPCLRCVADTDFAVFAYPMNLEDVLCQVQSDCRNLHFGRPFQSVVVAKLHLGTSMPVSGGATIPLIRYYPQFRLML